MQPEILSENTHTLFINKPTGLVVTPGPGYEEADTLVGWLLDRYGEELRKVGVEGHRPGIVHRLDKDTSGVMVVAKTQLAFEHLVSQFKDRKVEKEYYAVVWGNVPQKRLKEVENKKTSYSDQWAETNHFFTISAPIGRNPNNRLKKAVVKDGKSAETRFRLSSVWGIGEDDVTCLRCYPKTGRTHQIRVHLKSFGHSVLGDSIYQSRKQKLSFDSAVRTGLLEDRLYLHAGRLSLKMPETEQPVTIEAPLPNEFVFPFRERDLS